MVREYLDKYKRAHKQLEASRSVQESWTLIQSCTTLLQNVGEFTLSLAELEPAIQAQVAEMHERVGQQDLADEFRYKVQRQAEVGELKRLAALLLLLQESHETSPGEFRVFRKVVDEAVRPLCALVHETTLVSIFGPIEGHLSDICPPEDVAGGVTVGHGEDLPDYSYAPQEYITQVGQYLMTLPQHLDSLLLAPSKALKAALEQSDERYTRDSPCGDVLLALIAEDTCALFLERVVQLEDLSTGTSKQLATDIGEWVRMGGSIEWMGCGGNYGLVALSTGRLPGERAGGAVPGSVADPAADVAVAACQPGELRERQCWV